MAANELPPIGSDEAPISEVPPNKEGSEDFSQGYNIMIDVLPTGFRVSDPMPLHPGPQMEADEEDTDLIPDLTSALKHVLAVIKENPLGESDQENFSAGYESATTDRGQGAAY